MKKSNPLENVHNLDQIDLSQVDPLPNQTQLIKIKQQLNSRPTDQTQTSQRYFFLKVKSMK